MCHIKDVIMIQYYSTEPQGNVADEPLGEIPVTLKSCSLLAGIWANISALHLLQQRGVENGGRQSGK